MWWDTDMGFESGLGQSRGGGMFPAAWMAGASMLSGFMANRTNKKEMEFAREMSNTSWQRAIRDMKLAGINPIVAFSQGGASTPGVSLDNPAEGVAENTGSVLQLMQLKKFQEEQIGLIRAQSNAANAAASESGVRAGAIAAQAKRDAESWEGSGRALSGQAALDKFAAEMNNLMANTDDVRVRKEINEVELEIKKLAKAGAEYTAEQYQALQDLINSLPAWVQPYIRTGIMILGASGVIPGISFLTGKALGKGSVKQSSNPGTGGKGSPVSGKSGTTVDMGPEFNPPVKKGPYD